MKGIHYPNTMFLEARKGARPSWAWSSIVEGRQVLVEEGVWQVGNGESINVTRDKWIPHLENHILSEQNRK